MVEKKKTNKKSTTKSKTFDKDEIEKIINTIQNRSKDVLLGIDQAEKYNIADNVRKLEDLIDFYKEINVEAPFIIHIVRIISKIGDNFFDLQQDRDLYLSLFYQLLAVPAKLVPHIVQMILNKLRGKMFNIL